MVAERVQALQEKNEFLRNVENEVKPIRRAAYLEQIKSQAVAEGRMLALKASEKKLKQNTPIEKNETADKIVKDNWAMSDPLKYLNKQNTEKNGN